MKIQASRLHQQIDLRVVTSLTLAVFVLIYSILFTGRLYAQSAATQQFFGFSGAGGGGSGLPASCDISKLLAQVKQLEKQLNDVNTNQQAQLNKIQEEQKNLKPGDTAGGAALEAEQQQILNDGKSQRAAIKAKEEAIHKQTEGPSDQCKRDTVAAAVGEISGVESFVTSSAPATLNKVDTEITKIEKMEPKLQASGVNSQDIKTIKADVAKVKAASSTLRGYFAGMGGRAASFIARANSDPIGTYAAMQSGGPLGGSSSGAAGAADNLVSSFTSLVNLFDKLSSTGGK
ncbi:MAG TPA: hypothetical protein VFW90_00765 [Candidatus Saccharimonadales bacterium]|nr:hypothetical protein [Candidatus Saccharimonadales bacterium]